MSDETARIANLEQRVRVLDNALWRIARDGCQYYGERRAPSPCDCTVCEARAALAMADDWRYIGAKHERTLNGYNPREAKMHAAWKKLVDDFMLAKILYDGPYVNGQPRDFVPMPSARDWFVATSVVQWLATNVGSSVLDAAGFKYSQYEQDRLSMERLRDAQTKEQP